MDYSLLTIFSFFMGIVVGLTGIAGSSSIKPLLIFVFQVPATTAVDSYVVAAGLLKVVGTLRHWQQQTIELEVVKWLVIGIVPGSLLGLVGFRYFQQNSPINLDQWLPHIIGLVLMTFFHLDSPKLVGTDLSQASILLTCTSIGHLGLGTVDWNLVLPIWLGAIPGVVVGARLSEYLPKNALKILLYSLLVTISWRLLQPLIPRVHSKVIILPINRSGLVATK